MGTSAKNYKCTIDLETTYGTGDGAPTPIPVNADAIPTMQKEMVEALQSVSPFKQVGRISMPYWEVELKAYLKGATPSTAASELSKLLKICGMSETSATGTLTYSPVISSFPSATIVINTNGIAYTMKGARGGLEINCNAGKPVELTAKVRGLYEIRSGVSYTAATYTDASIQAPLFSNIGLTIGGNTHVLDNIKFNLGGFPEIIPDGNTSSDTGIGSFDITDQDTFGGSFKIQRDSTSDIEYWTNLINSSTVALASTNGFGATGNKFKVSSSAIQFTDVKEVIQNRYLYYEISFDLIYNATLANVFSLTHLVTVP